ncbi:MAG: DUF2971 domain-containing protein [Clostridiales bacterium]|nr:DUF2971 domain-containing protein [Clostridiales bacterium]
MDWKDSFKYKSVKDLVSLKKIKKDETLYHYTKIDGVLGMMERKNFRATKSDFLNDFKEAAYMVEVIKRVCGQIFLDPYQRQFFLSRLLQDTETEDNFIFEQRKDYFILSFSIYSDSITLWAEFGNETGYNIEFDNQAGLIGNTGMEEYDGYVIYEPSVQEEYLRKLMVETIPEHMGISLKKVLELRENGNLEVFDQYMALLQQVVVIYAMFFKQQEFCEEKEYRYCFLRKDGIEVLFRDRGGVIIPYLEIPIGNQKDSVPIKSITVAPKNHSDLAKIGMQYYFQVRGYNIPVYLSKMKLRY